MHAARVAMPEAKLASVLLALAAAFAFIGYCTRIATAAVVVLFGFLHIQYGLIEGNYSRI